MNQIQEQDITKNKEIDLIKVNSEILQLRNQQFLLGTISLSGSGLFALFNSETAFGATGMAALCGWLAMLFIIFKWSLGLRILIRILSEYAEQKGSLWEKDFRNFRENDKKNSDDKKKIKLYESQTRNTKRVFQAYGYFFSIYSLAGMFSAITIGHFIVLITAIVYIILIENEYKIFGRKEKEIADNSINFS